MGIYYYARTYECKTDERVALSVTFLWSPIVRRLVYYEPIVKLIQDFDQVG
jgi:hypothetical protein